MSSPRNVSRNAAADSDNKEIKDDDDDDDDDDDEDDVAFPATRRVVSCNIGDELSPRPLPLPLPLARVLVFFSATTLRGARVWEAAVALSSLSLSSPCTFRVSVYVVCA